MHVHALSGRPFGGRARSGAPPDPVAQAGRMRLRPEQAGRVREHRRGIGLGEAGAGQSLEEDLGVLACHVGVGLALGRRVAEVAEAIDDLLGRAAADPELQPAARDEVGGTGVFDHVQRVLVAHVDDGRPDLDALGPSADRREERERRGQLLGEVVDAEVRAVGAEVLDSLGELDRLDERVRARPDLRVGRRGPMSERQETDLLHPPILGARRRAVRLSRAGRRPAPRTWRGLTRIAMISQETPASGRMCRAPRLDGRVGLSQLIGPADVHGRATGPAGVRVKTISPSPSNAG